MIKQPRPQSTFVTVVACIFLAFSGLGVLVGLMQGVMLFTVFSTEVMDQMRDDMARQEVPAVFRVMVFGMPWFIVTAFLHSLVTLVSSIGLLRRRDWARRVFIVLMVLAIVMGLAGLGLQYYVFTSVHEEFAQAAHHGAPDIGPVLVVFGIIGVAMAVTMAALHGWIAHRLTSPEIVAEFRS